MKKEPIDPKEFIRAIVYHAGAFAISFAAVAGVGVGLCQAFVALGGLSRSTAFNDGSLTVIYFFSVLIAIGLTVGIMWRVAPKEPPDIVKLKKDRENLREIVNKLTGGDEE